MIVNQNNYGEKNKNLELGWDSLLFIFAIILIPHISLLHSAFPYKILDKSLALIGIESLIITSSTLSLIKTSYNRFFVGIMASFVLVFTSIIVRMEFYDLNIFHEIVYIRPFLTLPFVLIAALYHARNEQFIKAVSWIIILTGLSQALIGIIHAYVLPEIVLGAPAAVVGKFFYIDSINGAFLRSRETGTIGSATYYANFILMAMFVLVWKKPSFKILPNILNILFRAIFSFILLFGIILSLNRLTIILTVICAFFSFGELSFSNFKKKMPHCLFLSGIIIAFVAIKYPQLIIRFRSEGLIGRAQGYELAFNYFVETWRSFLIGIPDYIEMRLRSIDNFSFSDNSFLMLIMQVGAPIFWLWFLNLILMFKDEFKLRFTPFKIFFVFCFFINCFLTEILYCDGWMVYVALVTVFIFKKSDYKSTSSILIS